MGLAGRGRHGAPLGGAMARRHRCRQRAAGYLPRPARLLPGRPRGTVAASTGRPVLARRSAGARQDVPDRRRERPPHRRAGGAAGRTGAPEHRTARRVAAGRHRSRLTAQRPVAHAVTGGLPRAGPAGPTPPSRPHHACPSGAAARSRRLAPLRPRHQDPPAVHVALLAQDRPAARVRVAIADWRGLGRQRRAAWQGGHFCAAGRRLRLRRHQHHH